MDIKTWIKRQLRQVLGPRRQAQQPAMPPQPTGPPRIAASNHQGTGPHKLADVIQHYETLAPAYQEVYGDVYQAARPFEIEKLLQRELESAAFEDGQRVLDAGCGICGPAIWFTKHKEITVDAVTISTAQLEVATQAVAKANLSDRIKVHLGDYQRLEEILPTESYDCVYFLESLCHAESYRKVLSSAWKMLKPGGCIYIKDYLELDLSHDPARQARADFFLKRAYAEYHFTLVQPREMAAMLDEIGYKVEFWEDNPFSGDQEDLSVQVGFEKKVGFHWREGLDVRPIDSVEIRARKPA
jgi:ubiquinone/menaquinone biosynthesis C-methylase UbiE